MLLSFDIHQFPWDVYQLTSTYSFHTSQKPFLFDSSLTSHLPFQSSVGHAPRERRRFQSWGQHNNCISPFFHVPWTWSRADPLLPGEKTNWTQPSLRWSRIYSISALPSKQTGETARCRVLLVVEIDHLHITNSS